MTNIKLTYHAYSWIKESVGIGLMDLVAAF